MKKYITQHTIAAALIGLVIGGAGGVFGEMHFAAAARGARFAGANGATFQGTGAGGARGMRGGFTSGEVTSKDATSLTIKSMDGSSKIALISASTQVTKSAPGTIDDVAVGTQVLVTGPINADQSVTAQTIQIRPALPLPRANAQ